MTMPVILTYHGIGEIHRPLEPGEADVWLSELEFRETLEAAAALPEVTFTFDDSNGSDISIAAGALEECDRRGLFFALAGKIGEEGYLAESQLRELVTRGHTVGSHGMHHKPWLGLSPDELSLEIHDSRRLLEDLIQVPVELVACPFGSYGRRALGMLRSAGCTRVYTSDRGPANPKSWIQPRNTILTGCTPESVELMVAESRSAAPGVLRGLKLLVKRLR